MRPPPQERPQLTLTEGPASRQGRRARRKQIRLFPAKRRQELGLPRKKKKKKGRGGAGLGKALRGDQIVMPEDRSPRRVTFSPRTTETDFRPPALRRRSPSPPRKGSKGKGKGKHKDMGKGKGKTDKGKDKGKQDEPRRRQRRR